MDYKAVAIDLDGTLCTNREIHPKDKEALERTLEKKIPIVPATTRMRFSTSLILEEVNIDEYPLICNNGARVISPGWKSEGEYEDWYESYLDRNVAEELLLYSDEKNYEITTVFKEKKYWSKRRGQKHGESSLYPVTRLVENNIEALNKGPPLSLMMRSDINGRNGLKDFESYARDFFQKVRLDRHHSSQEWMALTVYTSEISKKQALELVCEKIDISIDGVLAIGDDEVDIGLLKSAGQGIAMGNSPCSVKKVADEIAPSCENQGVEWALRNYVL